MILRLSRHLRNRTRRADNRLFMGNGYLPAAPEKNPGPPARQSARAEDPGIVSVTRRRGDRIALAFFAAVWSAPRGVDRWST